MVDIALAQQVLPARQAAKRATTNIAHQLNDSDSDSPPGRRRMSPNKIIVKYGKKGKSIRRRKASESNSKSLQSSCESGEFNSGNLVMSPTRTSDRKSSQGKPTRREKKQSPELALDTNIFSDSELTPVTSSEASTPQPSLPPTSPLSPPSHALEPFPLLSELNDFSSNPRNKRKRREDSPGPKLWKREELGDYVWVLIDEGCQVFDYEGPRALHREHLWWPGKISRSRLGSSVPLLIHLYGETPLGEKNVEVNNPTENNILPFENSARKAQFQTPTFVTPNRGRLSDVMSSPRKKAKRDRGNLEGRWRDAVQELCAEREGNQASPSTVPSTRRQDSNIRTSIMRDTDEESLPEVGENDWKASLASLPGETPNEYPTKTKRKETVQSQARQRRKGKRKVPPISDDESDYGIRQLEEGAWSMSGEHEWLIPTADEALQIPGELIFALGTGGDRHYWPARVLEYTPPKSPREKEGKYKIEYLDRETAVLKRGSFYTWEEDGFVTCKLGQFESSYDENVNDSEAEEPHDSLPHARGTSPIPAYPPPSTEEFCELDVRSQLAYTKPILVAILNEGYPPAKARHDNFLKGGLARKSAVDGAALRGEMDPRSVAELHKWLSYWCLRDEVSVGRGFKAAPSREGSQDSPKKGPDADVAVSGDEHHQLEDAKSLVSPQMSQTGDAVLGSSISAMKSDPGDETCTLAQETSAINSGVTDEPCATSPLSASMDTASAPLEGLPNTSPVDVPMEVAKLIDQDPPLSPLSSTHQMTPAPVENNEDHSIQSKKDDINDAVPDLAVAEHPVQSTALDNEADATERIHSLPRQYGCPAFEALTVVEKLDYCLNVLLPEAILQVLLWRKGLRNAMELLSLDEEQRLHEEGTKLLQVTDWVFDVMRLRHSRERRLRIGNKPNGDITSSQQSERGGGRLRNVGRVNYVE